MTSPLIWLAALPLLLLVAIPAGAASEPTSDSTAAASSGSTTRLPHWDFTERRGTHGWQPTHDVASLTPSPEGLVIAINGVDPYLYGPVIDTPAGQPLWLQIRLKSEQGGDGQVFYFHDHPSEENSVHFLARPGGWTEARVPLPPLGSDYHLRLDPPGTGGLCTVASISLAPRVPFFEPEWPAFQVPHPGPEALSFRSGDLRLRHGSKLGDFVLEANDHPLAVGWNNARMGWVDGDHLRWLDLRNASSRVTHSNGGIEVQASIRDEGGATWSIRQRFFPGSRGTVRVDSSVSVDRDRSVAFLPMLMVFPGAGSFGSQKEQGLFAGLEYLENEPSSSEADITGPAHQRQVPDTLKVTFPLMAIAADHRVLALSWEMAPEFAALFDSPDRIFHSGAHLMGILFPGSDGHNRTEGSLLPHEGKTIPAGYPVTLHATFFSSEGDTVIPAVQAYLAQHPLPAVPREGASRQDALRNATAGWLHSAVRVGDEFRHATPGSFGPQPAADAAAWLRWLAVQDENRTEAQAMRDLSQGALARVSPGDYLFSGVGHVHFPITPLLFGDVPENSERAIDQGRALLQQFDAGGGIHYHPRPGGMDFGRTQPSGEANGLTAQVVSSLLSLAEFSNDQTLKTVGIRVLQSMDRFAGGVPRGAQTWEVPLHTPDILAAAHLVDAYTRGYELTGDRHFLNQAREWAWTGVPFVYLRKPVEEPIGLYSTIAVLGATHWVAPVWMGMPVQWCGNVYAAALYQLAKYDPKGPWLRLADGITASAVQQSWPAGSDPERQGLLPDSFNLRAQARNNPGINPATVLSGVQRLYGPVFYDQVALPDRGVLILAPGAIFGLENQPDHLSFTVHGWSPEPYTILINGFPRLPQVLVNGNPTPADAVQWLSDRHQLLLRLSGIPTVRLQFQ